MQIREELLMKRYINSALLYAILAMAGGVFYREFTKFNGFTAKTTPSVVHTHYFNRAGRQKKFSFPFYQTCAIIIM